MRIYLSGDVNDLTDGECKDWRGEAKRQLRCETVDPMRRDYRGKETITSVDDLVDGDKADIKLSDAVLVNASRPSWGTAMEIIFAYERLIPVIVVCPAEKVSPWLKYHAVDIFTTLKEACDFINDSLAEPTKINHKKKAA